MKFKPFLFAITLFGLSISNSYALKVNLVDHGNMNTTQVQKMNQVITVLNQILNTAEFKDKVLNFSYNGKTEFVQNNGMTNQQVYDFIMGGAEEYPKQTQANDLADMRLTIYYPPWWKPFSSAVAFTNTDDPYLHVYAKYYGNATIPQLCNTFIHEWLHKMGFDHDFNSTAQRPYSVPYGVGGIINDLAVKYLGSNTRSP